MDVATLVKAEPGLSLSGAQALVNAVNDAMIRCGCTDRKSAAMFLAQTGAESSSLTQFTEYADGSEYEGRIDLGNTQPGDGARFKGRGPIQLTGRTNYSAFSGWCYKNKLTSDPQRFVKHPEQVAEPGWGMLATVYYWTVSRASLTYYAKRGDVQTCTQLINGGYNNLWGRQNRYNICYALGDKILPSAGKDWFDMATLADLRNVVNAAIDQRVTRLLGGRKTGHGNALYQPGTKVPKGTVGVGDLFSPGTDEQHAEVMAAIAALNQRLDAMGVAKAGTP